MNDEQTIHELILLRIDQELSDPRSPQRDEQSGGLREDKLAGALGGEFNRPAADFAYAIRDLEKSGDIADLSRIRLTEKGARRVRDLRRAMEGDAKMVIDRDKLMRGPEPYLGWWLEGAPGPMMQPTSYVCYASEDQGDSRFQVKIDVSALSLGHAEKYEKAIEAAFDAAKGFVFLGAWHNGRQYGIDLAQRRGKLPSPQIRDALIRGLHRLYEDGFSQEDAIVSYEGVALALGISEMLVERAAEHLKDIGMVSEPGTMGRNWSTGNIWLTASGVTYAEALPPLATGEDVAMIHGDVGERGVLWDLFISHASEDKEEVAKPLALLLEAKGLKVWLDENELSLGDSLRAKIDHGLANSRHGLVILSASFFEKEWPQRELDGLVALESAKRKVILPVWHGVDREYVASFSPILADKYAVSTSQGLDRVVDEVTRAIGA